MRMLVSDMAGRANIQIKGEELGFDLSDRNLAARITDRVKDAEAAGYTYEAADASFELLLRRELNQLPEFFSVQSWRVFTQSVAVPAGTALGGHETDTECTVRLTAKGQSQRVVGEGNGPVNALDQAIRNALLPAYPTVDKFELSDYRVRILDQGHGSDATVRVLIQTTDGRRAWTTVGVGQNIVEASWEALSDAYLYGLIHATEPAESATPLSAPQPVSV
jgi:2-isopropylmalate synthase